MFTFTTTLLTDPESLTARFIELPDEIATALGAKARLRVHGTLNGIPFQTALAKYRDTGYVFPMKKSLREEVGVDVGDTVIVAIEQNLESRPALPDEVAAALAAHPAAKRAWDRLPPSHQREHLTHINEAKQAETRTRRIAKMVETLEK